MLSRESQAFVQAILENPADETLRLIFSDWLEENGDPARAEVIRVECHLDRLLTASPNRHALVFRARQLLCTSGGLFRYEGNLSEGVEADDQHLVGAHGRRWATPIADLVNYWGFRRGFVEEVGMTGRQFVADAETLFRLAPVGHVELSNVMPVLVPPKLIDSPWLGRLRSIGLDQNHIGRKGATALARCPHLGGLTALNLTHGHIGDIGLTALLASPYLTGLKALDLWNNDLTDASANLLVGRPLEYLSLGCNSLSEEAQQMLRERFGDRVTFWLYGGSHPNLHA
jgi:uncharacterized protein (TIGR02996 family)